MNYIICPNCEGKLQRKMTLFQRFGYYFTHPLFPFAKSIKQCPECGQMYMLSNLQCVVFGVLHMIALSALVWVEAGIEVLLPAALDGLAWTMLDRLLHYMCWCILIQTALTISKTFVPWESITKEDLLIWGDKGNKRLLLAMFISTALSILANTMIATYIVQAKR